MAIPELTWETNRILARPPTRADAKVVFENYASDPEVAKYMTWRPHRDLAETLEFLRRCERVWIDGSAFPWSLWLKDSGEFVGTASAIHNPAGSRFHFPAGGELGYFVVAATHRGQGLGSALICAVIDRFRKAGYQHIWLGVQGWRLPAISLYLRHGFRPFLHPPNADQLERRWRRILAKLESDLSLDACPRELPSSRNAS